MTPGCEETLGVLEVPAAQQKPQVMGRSAKIGGYSL